jgi:hypothetical protein
MKINPWVASYQFGNDPGRYSSLERRALPVDFKGGTLQVQAEELRYAMREVFLCGQQCSAILDHFLSLGESHAIAKCSSPHQVLEGCYSNSPWGETGLPAVMLTGLAGTGKSQLVSALKRLLDTRKATVDLPAHPGLTLQPGWFLSLQDGNTLNALLSPYLLSDRLAERPHSLGATKALNQVRLLELARRASRREGTCLLVIDEFQFITKSLQANTLAMSLLLQLMSIGPRIVYVANFSLVRRLLSRRQEDRHRVLCNYVELLPDAVDSDDFHDYVRELTRVRPMDWGADFFDFELLHRYTFGIKRAVVELLVNAWLHAKTLHGFGAKVTIVDLKSAYSSARYLPYRLDVEAVWRHSLGQKDVSLDLINPLRPSAPAANVLKVQAAIDSFNQRVHERHIEAMLTPIEQDALAQLSTTKDTRQSAGKIRRLPGRPPRTSDLLDAFSKLQMDS